MAELMVHAAWTVPGKVDLCLPDGRRLKMPLGRALNLPGKAGQGRPGTDGFGFTGLARWRAGFISFSPPTSATQPTTPSSSSKKNVRQVVLDNRQPRSWWQSAAAAASLLSPVGAVRGPINQASQGHNLAAALPPSAVHLPHNSGAQQLGLQKSSRGICRAAPAEPRSR